MSDDPFRLRQELLALQDAYVACLDEDRLEDWPTFFLENALYELIARENVDAGLPAPLLRFDNVRMMRDRVTSLRQANIYERPSYRHMLSGLIVSAGPLDGFAVRCSYVVVNTTRSGESVVYQAGRYVDEIVRTADGLRFASKRAIYDTSRVQTLLAYPI